jgi:hypothetical protein
MVSRQREEISIHQRLVTFAPAAVGTAETTPIMSIKKGDMVIAVDIRKKILAAAGSTSTISIGDGGDVDRFVAVIDTETGSADDWVIGVTAVFPYTYNADDTIDADYIIGGTPDTTNPQWLVRVRWIPLNAEQERIQRFR